MNWRPVGRGRWRSEDDRYEIWVQSRPRHDGVCYAAMPLPGLPDVSIGKQWLGARFSFSEAKAACVAHKQAKQMAGSNGQN